MQSKITIVVWEANYRGEIIEERGWEGKTMNSQCGKLITQARKEENRKCNGKKYIDGSMES